MKRYKLGQRRTKTDTHGNSATMPDMIECENGEYIKYAEYEQLLESIGAGGVGGRVTQPDRSNDELCQSVIKLIEILEDWHEEFPDHVGDKEMPAIEQARAALAQQDADKVDAERYRLLRRGQHWSVINGIGDALRADELDAAIDAARKEQIK